MEIMERERNINLVKKEDEVKIEKLDIQQFSELTEDRHFFCNDAFVNCEIQGDKHCIVTADTR